MATVRNRGDDSTKIQKSQDNSRIALTPSDTVKLPVAIDAIYVGGAGNVRMDDGNGGQITVPFLAGGPYFVGGITQIYATLTTATGIVGVASKALR